MEVDEEQASGEPTSEVMDQSGETSSSSRQRSNISTRPATASDKAANKQMIVKQKIERYFHLLTQGCSNPNCTNPNCASNPKQRRISGNEAAVKAIQLLQQKAEICPAYDADSAMNEASSSNVSKDGNSMSSQAAPKSEADSEIKSADENDLESSPMSVTQNSDPESSSKDCVEEAMTTNKEARENDKKNLKVYRVKDVKYLTEDMIDELLLKCKEDEEESLKEGMSDINSKQNVKRDPYTKLFVALTEVFSNMESLNRSFVKRKDGGAATGPLKENTGVVPESKDNMMDIDNQDGKTEASQDVTDKSVIRNDPSDSQAPFNNEAILSSALSSYFSTMDYPRSLPNTSGRRHSDTTKKIVPPLHEYKVSAPTVDVDSVRRVYKKLQGIERVNDAFVSSLELLTQDMSAQLSIMKQQRSTLNLNVFVIIMENPELHSPEYLLSALPAFCKIMGGLSDGPTVQLVNWWSKYDEDRLRTMVQCIQQLLTYQILNARLLQDDESEPLDLHKNDIVANGVKCLKILYYASLVGGLAEGEKNYSHPQSNSVAATGYEFELDKKSWKDSLGKVLEVDEDVVSKPILPAEEFQNDLFNESCSVYNDFTNVFIGDVQDNEFTFMDYPFILNIVNKTTFFFYDNKVQMLSGRRLMILQSILNHSPVSPYLRLKIRRDHVIDDALVRLELIASDNPIDLRKQLYVEFEGEQGVDEGGVSKEFFQLVVEQIFNPDYGMFIYDEDTHLYWFNQHSFENGGQFTLIGIVLGLAIYNSCILDIKFPKFVYKKLIGKKARFSDMKQSHPTIYESLKQLLAYDGNAEDLLAVFSVEYKDMFGESRKHELKPGGENIPVTNDNRKEFVELYANWLLNDSIQAQFNAFRHGFDLVVGKSPLKYLFRSDELEILISGSQEYDFHSLESATEYDGGFTKDSETVKHFWEVTHDMSEEDKKRLLQFTTGTDRAPVGGLAQLKLVIARNGPDSDRLPTAHTCFNVILLPDYKDREKLKERLHKAITHAKGFGML